MALPQSGSLSFNNIRIEQNQPTKSFYNIIDSSTGNMGYSSINPDSILKPNNTPPYSISEWYGYSATTIVWNNTNRTKLEIFVNNNKIIDTNETTGSIFNVSKNDTFYATFTPLSYGAFTSLNLEISQRSSTSPFPFSLQQSISRSTGNFNPNSTSATPITVSPNSAGMGAYRINVFGTPIS